MAVALDIVTNPPSQPYRYGLFSAATVYDDASFDPRGGDYTWRVQGCTPGAEWDYCWQSPYETQDPKSVLPDQWMQASPFVVYDGVTCLRVGEPDLGPVAESRLTLSEQGQAERHFWAQLGDEAADTDDAILTDAGTPFASVTDAIGALEAQLAATTGAAGVIHIPRYAISQLDACAIVRDGSTLRTLLGTPIVAGGGYGYTGPDDADTDDVLWIYATGPVTVRRGVVQVYGGDAGGFDQKTNEVWHIAERPYLITADCPILAAAATAPGRPDTVWPTPPRVPFEMHVDASDPRNVKATFTGAAACDAVDMTWGDGSASSVPVDKATGTGAIAHDYSTSRPPTARTRTKRATTAPKSSKKKGR
ncbi:hypothetical protein ACWD2L_00425 [Streptomyces sp. NPDC002754]